MIAEVLAKLQKFCDDMSYQEYMSIWRDPKHLAGSGSGTGGYRSGSGTKPDQKSQKICIITLKIHH
jgi:hypothetical protein